MYLFRASVVKYIFLLFFESLKVAHASLLSAPLKHLNICWIQVLMNKVPQKQTQKKLFHQQGEQKKCGFAEANVSHVHNLPFTDSPVLLCLERLENLHHDQ